MLWPNIDAGSDDISTGIRVYREVYNKDSGEWLKLFMRSYENKYRTRMIVPRWTEIEENYINKK